MSIEEQKSRSRDLRDLGPLAGAWESYRNLRKVSFASPFLGSLCTTHQTKLNGGVGMDLGDP